MEAARKTVVDLTEDRYMTIRHAARELGIAPQTVITRVLDGRLTMELVAGRRVITRESVERMRHETAST